MNIDIGSKIKTLRLSKSMTQEQLAKALHVSAQAVSKWENGSSLPDIQLLPALSVTLGTSIDSLFSLTDESRFARIDNMLWDKRFLTQQEFDEEEHFLQEKCRKEETRPRATLLLAELYCKRAREYNDLASPLARQALALNPDCKEAHNAIFDAEHGAYLDWNATNHYRTIAFYQEFLAAHPENHSAHLWLLDLLIADRRCAEAREVLDKMHRLKPTYNDDFYLGCILLQEGHTDDALAQWEAMCAKYPDTWEVYVMRASSPSSLTTTRPSRTMKRRWRSCRPRALSTLPRPSRRSAKFAVTMKRRSPTTKRSSPSKRPTGTKRRAKPSTPRSEASQGCAKSWQAADIGAKRRLSKSFDKQFSLM